jgi:hypothetical protein
MDFPLLAVNNITGRERERERNLHTKSYKAKLE